MRHRKDFVFTSESVAAGHPDKICDQISDAVLDAIIANDDNPIGARGAIEVLATTQHLTLAGEYKQSKPRSRNIDFKAIARGVIQDLGYTNPAFGFDNTNCEILAKLHDQNWEIRKQVEGMDKSEGNTEPSQVRIKAGDQGLMFGYAIRETESLMPMPIYAAHRLIQTIDLLREAGEIKGLRPDGKCQLSVRYAGGRPVELTKVVIAVPHDDSIIKKDALMCESWQKALEPLLPKWQVDFKPEPGSNFIVNGTGDWTVGGPSADTGLTGRKIIVDTYGGWSRHGGGCFSGKDPSKVDRSGAYMMRYIAKNIVAAGLADECEIQVAYAIGGEKPLSLTVFSNGTIKSTLSDTDLKDIVWEVFDLSPESIIRSLDLFRPIYRKTAAYGHFGREEPEFTWERVDRVNELKAVAARYLR
jgi:S-adenosylmethionine synthetase